MAMEKEKLELQVEQLIRERGYVKSSITRLATFAQNNAELQAASLSSIKSRRDRLVTLLADYDKYNKCIMSLTSEDAEEIGDVEEKYFNAFSAFSDQIENRTKVYAELKELPSPMPIKKINLPVINIDAFKGECSKYVPFINIFKSVIDTDNAIDNVQKLHYLRSFLQDEPFDLIKHLPISNSSYKEALDLLQARYYNEFRIVSDHVCQLLDLRSITRSVPSEIRHFVSIVKQNLSALKNLHTKVYAWDPVLICILTRKLDMHTARAYQLERDASEKPTIIQLLDFLEKRALALENAELGSLKKVAAVVHTAAVVKEINTGCRYCSGEHKLFTCKSFKLLSDKERVQFVKNKKLCNVCLNDHLGKCKYHFRCGHCKQSHNTLVHLNDENRQKSAPVTLMTGNYNSVLIPTARVKLIGRDNREVHVKAILDSASQASMVTGKVVDILGLTPVRNNTTIIGIANSVNSCKYSIPLEVYSLTSSYKTSINCHVVDQITCQMPQTKIDLSAIHIPPGIDLADKDWNTPSDINMLIGADVFFQILQAEPPSSNMKACTQLQLGICQEPPEPCSQVKSSRHIKGATPRLINTAFGYIIAGSLPVHQHSNKVITLHCTKCDSVVNESLKTFWEAEKVPEVFQEQTSEHNVAENIFQSTIKLQNNKFQVDLPLKVPIDEVNNSLGSSFDQAFYRFLNLERKLHKDVNMLDEYRKFIHEYVELGHAHVVDLKLYNLNKEPVYFLPHHAVVNECSKTTRTRVVFDGSMKTNKKISLNDILLNGPKVQRDLFDIILLYRFGDYTFNTDIRKMFRNILVNPEQTSLQNILWRDNPGDTIQCLRLDTVTYGLKSSTYLATRCLDELANQHECSLPMASFILKNCTYVDDILYSNSNICTLLEAKCQLQQLLKLGSFSTHKWSANNQRTLTDIPSSQQQFDNIELQKENNSIKALGLMIDTKQDCFTIKAPKQLINNKITKRDILSQISKIYDPLGFVSPIVVKAKVIMQKLWLEKSDWDSNVPEVIAKEWLQFADDINNMNTIILKRNIPFSNNVQTLQLIGFADASSSTGQGCCIYCRVIDSTGKAKLFLLCSKSRINSTSKPLTVPRLELNAALLLAKLMTRVADTIALKVHVNNIFLFTDSQIVLAWINTEIMKLQAYVANRVRVIQELTNKWQWLYCQSQSNPADIISRGMGPQELDSCTLWWSGPAFLQNREYSFESNIQPLANLPELKPSSVLSGDVVLVGLKHANCLNFLDKYSDISKIKRILAYILRFCNNINPKSTKIQSNYLNSSELEQALFLIIKHEQNIHFKEEILSLHKNSNVKGNLKPLHPFIDKEGLLRVGGRLQNSQLPYSQKHPIILPKGSRYTELIIRHEHLRLLHAGPRCLLSNLNQRFWLINGMRQVKKVTHRCLTCFRMKATAAKQLMGSLPRQRVTASRVFNKIGIDFAGPFQVKNSRVRRSIIGKGYVLVIVCFVTKAIHLEIASDISTGTFLACMKRFISRRGLPAEVFCDNGGAFRGAGNHLADLYKLYSSADHQAQVQHFASQQEIQFHFTPSYSPVFAGLAEAAVKSMKHILKRTVQKCILTYEQLNTVLCQIEAILNSRPLMPISSDVTDFSYLTPGHFLVGGPLTSYPESDISDTPSNRLSFWQNVESMKQSFWKVWHKQYLNQLQFRPKWRDDLPNLKLGTLVILRDKNTSPLYWPMARVVKIFPGNDQKVRAFEVKTASGKTYTRSLSGVSVLPLE